jgi:hypothetical protein
MIYCYLTVSNTPFSHDRAVLYLFAPKNGKTLQIFRVAQSKLESVAAKMFARYMEACRNRGTHDGAAKKTWLDYFG